VFCCLGGGGGLCVWVWVGGGGGVLWVLYQTLFDRVVVCVSPGTLWLLEAHALSPSFGAIADPSKNMNTMRLSRKQKKAGGTAGLFVKMLSLMDDADLRAWEPSL